MAKGKDGDADDGPDRLAIVRQTGFMRKRQGAGHDTQTKGANRNREQITVLKSAASEPEGAKANCDCEAELVNQRIDEQTADCRKHRQQDCTRDAVHHA